MFFSKCAPNVVLGGEGTLAHTIHTFWITSGSQTKHTFCYQDMSAARIMCLGVQLHRRMSYSGRYTKKWVAISKHGIIGPFWFDDENEQPLTVNKERYVAVLRKFLVSLGRRRRMDRYQQWFQQDGATPHISKVSLAWLRERFDDRLISRMCDVEGAAHSPDLKPQILLYVGVSQGQCVWEQSSNNRRNEGSNQTKYQANPQGGMCETLTILRDVCKCAFNAEDNIWSTFWKEHKHYANWLR